MESMRDVNRVMEREIAKGSCPLKLERIEIGADAYQEITSQEKLYEVLSYLLRVGDFKQYAGKMVGNNVYMDIKGRKPVFHRTRSILERNNILATSKRYAGKLKPDYEGKVYLETAKCFFTISEKDMVKYSYVFEGKETYAFTMSDKYIMGLYTQCLIQRKAYSGNMRNNTLLNNGQNIMDLEMIEDVLFQCLILDDVKVEGTKISANLQGIYVGTELCEI